MSFTRTADFKASHTRELCKKISPSRGPVVLPIKSSTGCEPNDCFGCVKRKVQQEGGRIQFGWALWEWPHVYIEAEHHAVYEPPSGLPWIDITPSGLPHITHRLFLPDDEAPYDYEEEGILRDNYRVALVDDPLIEAFFQTARTRLQVMNSLPGVGAIPVDYSTAARIASLDKQRQQQTYQLAMRYTPQSARCFCGSGEKFKRCHGLDGRL